MFELVMRTQQIYQEPVVWYGFGDAKPAVRSKVCNLKAANRSGFGASSAGRERRDESILAWSRRSPRPLRQTLGKWLLLLAGFWLRREHHAQTAGFSSHVAQKTRWHHSGRRTWQPKGAWHG